MGFSLQKFGVDDINPALMIEVGVSGIKIGAAENGDVLAVVKHDLLVVPNLVAEEIEWTVIVGEEKSRPVAEPTFVAVIEPTLAGERRGEDNDGREAG